MTIIILITSNKNLQCSKFRPKLKKHVLKTIQRSKDKFVSFLKTQIPYYLEKSSTNFFIRTNKAK